LLAAALGCRSPWKTSSDAHAAIPAPALPAADAQPVQHPTIAVGYPVDTSAPKDFFSDALLRTLAREASAIVVCKLEGLTDVFPDRREPDTFYDAACHVTEVRAGAVGTEALHFVWQVERGSRMPPPGSELLVYLKRRKEPLDGPPPLKWGALDTGVMRYTEALRRKVGQNAHGSKKGK
jgi:hypothetical protein